jgi:hypothetical protein
MYVTIGTLQKKVKNLTLTVREFTKPIVTFYLPRPFHFLSYQSKRLLISDIGIVLMTFYFLEPKTIIVDLTTKF